MTRHRTHAIPRHWQWPDGGWISLVEYRDEWKPFIVKDSDSPAEECLTKLKEAFNEGRQSDEEDIDFLRKLTVESE